MRVLRARHAGLVPARSDDVSVLGALGFPSQAHHPLPRSQERHRLRSAGRARAGRLGVGQRRRAAGRGAAGRSPGADHREPGVGGALAYLYALQKGPVALIATVTALYPIFAIVLAALILQEPVSLRQGIGIALGLLAMVLVSR